jgi:hypothetical protein
MYMKKLSVLTLAFMSSFAVMAQDTGMDPDKAHKPMRTEMSTDVRFGIKAGVNLATFEIDDDDVADFETNNKTSFHAGVFVNIPLGGTLRFQPELVYSGQGTKGRFGTSNFESDYHYLNIPLMFQVQSPGGFFGELGPQVGFLLKAETEAGGTTVDVKDDAKKLDFGLSGGIGYLTRVGLGLNARYNLGFASIADNDDDEKYKNRVLSLGLVYHFGAAK